MKLGQLVKGVWISNYFRSKSWSGKGTALPPLPPIRTGLESFPSSGSSRSKAPPERSRYHDGEIVTGEFRIAFSN